MSTDDTTDELLSAFRDETADSLDMLLRLRDGWEGEGDVESTRRLLEAFRIFHNLKGASRLVGLHAIEPLAHAAEDRLRAYHDGEERPDESELDQLAHAIRAMLAHAEGILPAEAVLELARQFESTDSSKTPRVNVAEPAVRDPVATQAAPLAAPIDAALEPAERRVAETVRVRVGQIDRLIAMTGELLTHHAHLGVREARVESVADAIRDALRGLRGDSRDALVAVLGDVERLLASDRSERQRLGLLTTEFGETVRSVRMIPLAGSVPGFRRIAEDAASDLSKRIRFEADVGDIALDRRILEGLRDPMMHLLRNAVDHGIESASVRSVLGKPEVGVLTMRGRSLGAHVEITLSDDGGGIDREAVIARARTLGLLTAERASTVSDAEVHDLLFTPGFSTAASVSHLSGRGIGLDVVRSRVLELGGSVEIESSLRGTTFRLTLPVDVVQTKGLLVRVGGSVMAVPITQVVRTQRISAARVKRADGGTVAAQADDEPLRLLWLASLLGVAREPDGDSLMTVVVETAGSVVGLVVSEVLGEAEFVVRPLPWNLERIEGVVGAAVLGDGRLAVVLHLAALLSGGRRATGVDAHTLEASPARSGRSVLVVDDSVTSRILVRNILDAAGYETVVANDGEEAWEALQRRAFDLVVTDVQMPKLDGHGLTRRIRKDARTTDIPIIMVTSLARPEDIALGSEAGADEYIVKGRFDHRTLLEAVARLC